MVCKDDMKYIFYDNHEHIFNLSKQLSFIQSPKIKLILMYCNSIFSVDHANLLYIIDYLGNKRIPGDTTESLRLRTMMLNIQVLEDPLFSDLYINKKLMEGRLESICFYPTCPVSHLENVLLTLAIEHNSYHAWRLLVHNSDHIVLTEIISWPNMTQNIIEKLYISDPVKMSRFDQLVIDLGYDVLDTSVIVDTDIFQLLITKYLDVRSIMNFGASFTKELLIVSMSLEVLLNRKG